MGYTYKFYYQCLPDDLKKQIIDMWLNDNVFDLQIAKQRVEEVVLVIFDPNNEVCCVTTVYIAKNKMGNNVYMLRIYVRKKDRGKTKIKGSKLTHEYLKTYNHPLKPIGVIAVAENEKITERKMKSHGWDYVGKNIKNQDVYRVLF